MNMHQNKGFTMIELLIVVAIIAVLATIAYPSFLDSMKKSRRADAMGSLYKLQLNQEKWRANNTTYTSTLADVWDGGHDGKEEASIDGYYELSLAGGATGTGYTATATGTSRGDQSSDSCGNFILKLNSGSTEKSTSVYTDYTSDGAKRCWQRR